MGETRSQVAREFASLRRQIGDRQGASPTARLARTLEAARAAGAAAQGSFNPRLAGVASLPASLPWRFSLPYRACA